MIHRYYTITYIYSPKNVARQPFRIDDTIPDGHIRLHIASECRPISTQSETQPISIAVKQTQYDDWVSYAVNPDTLFTFLSTFGNIVTYE